MAAKAGDLPGQKFLREYADHFKIWVINPRKAKAKAALVAKAAKRAKETESEKE